MLTGIFSFLSCCGLHTGFSPFDLVCFTKQYKYCTSSTVNAHSAHREMEGNIDVKYDMYGQGIPNDVHPLSSLVPVLGHTIVI